MHELEKEMYYGATKQTLEKARLLRSRMTPSEEILWEKLKGKQFDGLRFRRQHPINTYIVDFYCHQARLVIELDGQVHKLQKQYDYERTEVLEGLGLKVIRFYNSEIEKDINVILKKIKMNL